MEVLEHASPEKNVFEMEVVKSEGYLDKNTYDGYVLVVEHSKS